MPADEVQSGARLRMLGLIREDESPGGLQDEVRRAQTQSSASQITNLFVSPAPTTSKSDIPPNDAGVLFHTIHTALLGKKLINAVNYSPAFAWHHLQEPASTEISNRSNFEASLCLRQARKLIAKNKSRTARQFIHELIDDLLSRGQYGTVDAILVSADPYTDDLGLLISLLTATKPGGSKLSIRGDVFAEIVTAVKHRKLDEPGLFDGLD